VASNNLGGSVEAVEHLLAHGHRRIGFLGDLPSISTAEQRLQGYTQALERAGIGRDDELVRTGLRDPEAAAGAARALLALPDPPTALFTSQNLLTIGGIRALRSAGLERRVALIGFDDVALADVLDPAVSVVAQDPQALGRSAADLLFRRLDGDTSPSVHHVVPVKLIARGSGEIPPPERGP
jgi:LacI family transcriptional regulator